MRVQEREGAEARSERRKGRGPQLFSSNHVTASLQSLPGITPPEVLTVFLTSTRGHGNDVCGRASFKSAKGWCCVWLQCILFLLPWPGEPTNPSQGQDCLLLPESSLTAHGPRVSISDLLLLCETSTALSTRLCYLRVFLHLLHNEWEVNECSLLAEPVLCSSPSLAL